MASTKQLVAELVGTFWLVLGGCGAAVLAAGYPQFGIGLLGISLAFGVTVLTMAYAIGPVSGCHLNPAVSVGLAVAGRFSWRLVPGYILMQVFGAIGAATVLLLIASGRPEFEVAAAGLAANGFAEGSPGGYGMEIVFLTELLLSFIFVFVILGVTSNRAARAAAPMTVGLALTLVHLVSIPVSNTSVNPARSTGPAVVLGGLPWEQLWLFWLAPIAGACLAGLFARFLLTPPRA